MKRFKYPAEIKLNAVNSYLNVKKTGHQIARELNVSTTTIQQWISLYKSFGLSGLTATSKEKVYSKKLKSKAISDYLSGHYSQLEVYEKYGMRSRYQLQDWILKYNSHEAFEERIRIVTYCIEHNRDYYEITEKFKVSYQQFRNWTVKYGKSGIDFFVDPRGKRKLEDQLTELEKLKVQNKFLEVPQKTFRDGE